MEILTALVILVGGAIYILNVHVSELHAKIDILLQDSSPDWEKYFTNEINIKLKENNAAKAAMLLRKETGLSFKYCLGIIEKHLASTSNA